MTRAGRLGSLLLAALVAVVAVVALARGGGDDPAPASQPSSAPAPEREPAEAEPRPAAEPDEEREADEEHEPRASAFAAAPLLTPGEARTVRVTEGETVRFRVRSPRADELHVHGYELTRALPAGRTVSVTFPARITGIFEVELHGTGEPLGRVRVDPR